MNEIAGFCDRTSYFGAAKCGVRYQCIGLGLRVVGRRGDGVRCVGC